MKEKACIVAALASCLASAELPRVSEQIDSNTKIDLNGEVFLRAGRANKYTIRLSGDGYKLVGVAGGGYDGINLGVHKLRLIVGEGAERRRVSISWEDNSDTFIGVSRSSFKENEQAAMFFGYGENGSRIEGTFSSDNQWRLRGLFENKLSVGVGESQGQTVGNLSLQDNNAWISSDFGANRPTEIRLVIGKIDNTRSDLVYGVRNRGRNEITRAGDPTIRFTDSDYEDGVSFQLARSMPARFLGSNKGDMAFDGRVFTSGRFDASLGVRVGDLATLKNTYMVFGLDRKLGEGVTWNGEVGGNINSEINFRFRVERNGKQFGILVAVRL